jgi:H+/Na+-translocating ferredoxin:NAD+ oxidoreductase subunit G
LSSLIMKLGLRLMIVCTVAAIGLGFTYTVVEKRIAEQDRKVKAEAADEVLAPIGAHAVEDPELLAELQPQFKDLVSVFRAVDESGEQKGYVFIVKSKGYNFITMAVGVDSNGQVTGTSVVTNEETPGVGAPVAEDPDFTGQFTGKGPELLVLGKDVDAVAGASFTSKGMTNGVNMALEIWNYLQENP